MAYIIEQVNVGGTTYSIASTAYGEATGNADIATKVVPSSYLNGITATPGVTIHVKFINANTAASPTLTLSGGDSTLNTAIPIVGISTWDAGAVLTLTYDGTNWVRDYETTVANNLTGSGTNGYLAKFNGTNSITNGPQIGSAVTNQTQETLFLRSDGTWAKPSYTENTHYTANLIVGASSSAKANAANTTTNSIFLNLVENNTVQNYHNIVGGGSVTVSCDANGKITITGNKSGTVTSITPGNGLINGTTGTSQTAITESGTISIKEGGVTNAMLAGSIANNKLSNSKVIIAGQEVSLGGSIDAATLRTKLGLTQALRFVGSTSSNMSESFTGIPAGISIYTGENAVTPAIGDVVLDSSNNAEYVCVAVSGNAYTWEALGAESSWALSNDVLHVSGTKGDLIYWSNTDSPAHLAIGTGNNKFLTISSGVPAWGTVSKTDVGLGNVTNYAQIEKRLGTTKGDIIYFSGNAAPERLAISSTTGQVLTVTSNGIPGWATPTVDWSNVTNKVLAALYVNATAAGAANDTAATTNSNTYLHLYDNSAKQSTIQLIGAGGTSISSTASSKNITITSKKYKSTGSANALTSLTLTYNNGTAQTNDVSSTAVAIGSVESAVLYIKSIKYGTTSVSTGVSEDNT